MKKTHALVAALALAAGLSAGTARAQLAVIDGANVAQTVQAVATAAKELAQLQMQLQQLQNTYRMFTNPTNITGMLPGLNTGMLRNPMPTTGQVPGMVMGMNGSLSGPGQSFLSQNQVYKPAGTDPLATQMNRSAMAIAQIQGMAATNLQSIEQRLANLSAMQTQLQSATDIKQVTAINGRIAIEQHAIQSQQAQATNLQTMAMGQIAAQQQQDQQLIRQGWDQLASQFSGGERPMTRLRILCGVAALLAVIVAVATLHRGSVGDHHTVDWYASHEAERQRVLQTCANDHALDDEPDCKNADAGERAVALKAIQEKLQRDMSKLEGEPEPKADH